MSFGIIVIGVTQAITSLKCIWLRIKDIHTGHVTIEHSGAFSPAGTHSILLIALLLHLSLNEYNTAMLQGILEEGVLLRGGEGDIGERFPHTWWKYSPLNSFIPGGIPSLAQKPLETAGLSSTMRVWNNCIGNT